MHHRLSKKNIQLVRRIAVYSGMTLMVVIIVTTVTFFVLGYRFDSSNGKVEQYALIQLKASLSGATVTIDGKTISTQTPNSTTVPAGKHIITIEKNNYDTWNKTIDVKAGTLKWLNYALLVPKKLTVEPAASYESIASSLASPKDDLILIQEQTNVPVFDLVDLNSDTIKTTKLTLPTNVYSDSNVANVVHTFQIEKWDDGGRYVIVKHTYDSKDELLVLDTQDVKSTKNITKMFDIAINDIYFSGTSGNIFYVLDSNDIRKLDLSAGTISRSLVSNVISFSVYNSNVITYISNNATDASKRDVGLYRDGDDKSYILRTIADSDGSPINVATTHYFNEDYVAISIGNKVDVLSGSYPNTSSDTTTSLKMLISQTVSSSIQNLSFSPTGEYVFMQSGAFIASYDLEYQSMVSSTISGNGNTTPVKWLNDNYVWSDRDGDLTIREFDGSNVHAINQVLIGQDAMITSNGRYIYSINKTAAGYQLQRVRMILP